MANPEHLEILKQDVVEWNQWREENPDVVPDLVGAILDNENLSFANLSNACLSGAKINYADLGSASLHCANLSKADLIHTNLSGANLSGANLSGANFGVANLSFAILRDVNLSGAYLAEALLVNADLSGAILTNCNVFGVSAWELQLDGAIQKDLVITREYESVITVDNLEVAQFIYLLLNKRKIRDVIDTITSKVVLILGRFTPERKAILDAIREELRRRDYLPVLFDFDVPSSRDITETVSTLAHLARFVIADITDAKSIPQELMRIVPSLPSVPIQPLLHVSDKEYGMFEHLKRYPWVLEAHIYDRIEELLASLSEKVISPAEKKAKELAM